MITFHQLWIPQGAKKLQMGMHCNRQGRHQYLIELDKVHFKTLNFLLFLDNQQNERRCIFGRTDVFSSTILLSYLNRGKILNLKVNKINK